MPQPCQRAAGQQCRRLAPSVSSNTAAAATAAAAAAPETATEKKEKKNTATRRRKDERKDGNPEISNRQTRQTTKQTGTSRHSPRSQPRLTPASGDVQGEAQTQTQTGRDQSCAERGWRGRGPVCKASQRVSPVTTMAIMLLNMGRAVTGLLSQLGPMGQAGLCRRVPAYRILLPIRPSARDAVVVCVCAGSSAGTSGVRRVPGKWAPSGIHASNGKVKVTCDGAAGAEI